MRTQFAWRADVSGDFVEVKLQDRGPARMIMKTLTAHWRDKKDIGVELEQVIEIYSQSPTHRRTSPFAESPMRKEQQALVQMLFATLEDLRGSSCSCLLQRERHDLIQQLDSAALEVLDAKQSQQHLQAIRDAVEMARCHLGK